MRTTLFCLVAGMLQAKRAAAAGREGKRLDRRAPQDSREFGHRRRTGVGERSKRVSMALVVCLLSTSAFASPSYRGSPAEKKARAKGRKVVKELRIDIDGDGRSEVGVVERYKNRMQLLVLKPTKSLEDRGGFQIVGKSSRRVGKRLIRFEAKRLVGRSPPELVAVIEDPTPDEKALTVVILSSMKGAIREIFAHTFLMPSASAEKPSTVSFGDASPHFLLTDIDEEDSDAEIVWVREPQTITLDGKHGPVTFVIGAVRTIYRFDAKKMTFRIDAKEDTESFLKPHEVSDVEATAQVPKIWGTAQAFWAVDGDLDTSWNTMRREAKGQKLTSKFTKPVVVSMIRVVPGCGGTEDEWEKYHRVRAFRLVLGTGEPRSRATAQRIEIDRRKVEGPPPGRVKAVSEFLLDGNYGGQLLIFLENPQRVRWVRFEILSVERSHEARADEVCVSEMSFH